jgi:hypothetical protein
LRGHLLEVGIVGAEIRGIPGPRGAEVRLKRAVSLSRAASCDNMPAFLLG